jgi:hypothetical protein
MAIEDVRNGSVLSLLYKLLAGAAHAMLATLAIALGIWVGSRFTMAHPQRETLSTISVGEEVRPRVVGVQKDAPDRQPIADYAPFGSMKIDTDFFAMVVEQTGTIHPGSPISGTGFGDVYDQKGRLIRRYAAVEDTNSSWELMEFMRLPRSGLGVSPAQNISLSPSRDPVRR